MAVGIIKISDNTSASIIEYVIDTRADVDELPTTRACGPGSTALCLEDSSVFMLGNDKIWHEI